MIKAVLTLLCFFVSAGLSAQSYGPYQAKVLQVLEADRIELEVGLWPGLSQQVKLGLSGIVAPHEAGDTPDCEKEAAQRAILEVRRLLTGKEYVSVDQVGPADDGILISGVLSVDGKNLSDVLIAAGLARRASVYTAPWCVDPESQEAEKVYCASDVRRCPDGTFVSRYPPSCEFIACP